MAKYYTPSIEEFHVGFEYEASHNAKALSDDEFEPRVIHGQEDFESLGKYEELRVKYLDQEDIKNLGWTKFSAQLYTMGHYHLSFHYQGRLVTIHNGGDYKQRETYFSGTIRNKSELRRIITQIGVL